MANPKSPLTILHLTLGAVLGGVTRYICDLGNGLSPMGYRTIAGGARGPWEELFHREGIPWIRLPLDGGAGSLWRAAGQIVKIVDEDGVDVIHCHFRRPLLACKLARLRGMPRLPIVYTLHLAPIPIGLSGRLVGFGDKVIAPAEEGRKWITTVAGVSPASVSLIPHGVDLKKWRPANPEERRTARDRFGIPDGHAVAAFVGRFEYPKNEQWVLELAAECKREHVPATFLMCGDGPNAQEVRSRIEAEGLQKLVRLPGYIDPRDAYHAADLVLLPSSIEGFGYVAAEAAACGVAVLRTRTAGWQETLEHGVSGKVVDVDQTRFISAAMELLGHTEILLSMGQAGRQFAEAHLGLISQVRATADLYQRRGSTHSD